MLLLSHTSHNATCHAYHSSQCRLPNLLSLPQSPDSCAGGSQLHRPQPQQQPDLKRQRQVRCRGVAGIVQCGVGLCSVVPPLQQPDVKRQRQV